MELGPVHHVSINCADVEATAPFYTEVLGMKTLERPDFPFNGRWLQTGGGGEVHLIEVEGKDCFSQWELIMRYQENIFLVLKFRL